ncbi:MAG: carbohydrate kinase family protein [Lachnospiraceae bacterium]|nr:carbohydrate kinase family protein [Lachnospiraceae bacterium]
MSKNKMIAAGHICIDITPLFQGERCENISELLVPGRLIHVGAADIHTGGSVANTGLAMKLLGADVSLMGKVGDDEFGRMILNILEKYNGAEGMIVDQESSTSYSAVLAVPGIDRIFLHNPGANDTFTGQDLDMTLIREAALFHFGYPPIMAKMYEDTGAELTRIFRMVKETGCMTSLDLAAVDEKSAAGKADWETVFQNTLPYVDFFLPSIEEICYMLDKDKYRELQERAACRDVTEVLSIKDDVIPLADRILSMGCKLVIIKCGAAGFYYKTQGKEAFEQLEKESGLDFSSFADQEGFEKSYVPDTVLSGTGAGDTMIAAFLTAMIQGYPFERCIQLAAATGASCVAAVDALSGLKPFNELIDRIDAGWAKNHMKI